MGKSRQAPSPAGKDAALAAHLRDCAATMQSDTARPFVPSPPRHEHRRFDPPRTPLLAGAGGLRLLLRIPGFVEKFDKVVPGTHLSSDEHGGMDVACACGGEPGNGSITPVDRNGISECEDQCGRWFLRTADDVILVARFEDVDQAEAA